MFCYQDIQNGKKPYVIAELCSNHNGDMELAKRMIDKAKECGADCVKFQSWTKDSLFSKKVYQDNYFLADDYRNRTDYTLEKIVDEYSIDHEDHVLLKKYCDEVGIEFSSTGFSPAEVDFLVDEFQVPFIKVASMDVNNLPLLRHAASKKKPVIISTGLCPLSEVMEGIECLEANGCKEIIVLHCVSIYPTPDEEANLNNIKMYQQILPYPVGYSDHTMGYVAPVMSLAMGACLIEKHFTLDHDMKGWDHKTSADPEEMRIICEAASRGYKMMGTCQKVVYESLERRNAFQRSIVSTRDMESGHVLTEQDIDYKRPGTGIPPKYSEFVIGRTLKKSVKMDDVLEMSDFV